MTSPTHISFSRVNWTCEGLKRDDEVKNKNTEDKSVNWTCEGLKQKMSFYHIWEKLPCELNLWGIETDTHPKMEFHNDKVWIEPVRDWNIRKRFQFAGSVLCELNLWGIETRLSSSGHLGCALVWIEPVRDWNNILTMLKSVIVWCVNWTCEGLKPRWWFTFRTYLNMCELNLWGIETFVKVF